MDESAFNKTIRQRMVNLQSAAWHLEQYLLLTSGIETVEGKAEPVPPQIEPPPADPPKLGKPLPKFKPGAKRGSKRVNKLKITYTAEQEQEIVRRYEAGESKKTISVSLGHGKSARGVDRVLIKHGIRIRTRGEQMKILHAKYGKNWYGRVNGDASKAMQTQREGEECLR